MTGEWQTTPGTGDLGLNSANTIYTGTVTAQILTAQTINLGTLKFTANSATLANSASAGGATALPATPGGYLTVQVSGVNVLIPFFGV